MYDYFAFISYKHEDLRFAKWLQRKLSNYRLPNQLAEIAGKRHLSPIFRDQTDLAPGALYDRLTDNLKASRHLIVICSPNTAKNPKYIDKEIQTFLESGHTPEQIIPVIINSVTDDPVEECFPTALKEIMTETEILGVNIADNGKQDTLLRIIAAMLGVNMTAVKNLDKIRQKRRRIITSITAAVFIMLISGFGYWYWDTQVEHVNYYVNFIIRNSVAEGIGEPLKKEQYTKMNLYAEITTKNHTVEKVRVLEGKGFVNTASLTIFSDINCAEIHYTYTNSKLTSAEYIDEYGKPVICLTYTEDDLSMAKLTSSAASNTFSQNLTNEDGSVTAINYYGMEYDENGFIASLDYLAVNGLNSINIANSDGICGYRYEYDDEGQVTTVYYKRKNNGSSEIMEDVIDHIIYSYKNYIRAEELYLNKNNQPTNNANGFTKLELIIDENLNISRINCYVSAVNLQYSFKCSANFTYENGRITNYTLLDINKNYMVPTWTDFDYASIDFKYNDESGILEKNYYYNKENKMILSVQYTDDGKNIKEAYYYDEKGQLNMEYGYASYENFYDEQSRITYTYYYDDKGRLASELEYAVIHYIYEDDESEFCPKIEYFNENEELFMYVTYEQQSNIITKVSNYDSDGKLFVYDNGFAKSERTIDEKGNITSWSYYDENEQPYLSPKYGSAKSEYEYNNSGLLTKHSFYDTAGHLIIHSGLGYASYELKYDENGNCINQAYFDENENLMINKKARFAEYKAEYHENGTHIYASYYDENGNLMINTRVVYAAIEAKYNENGNCTYQAYFDENNNLMIREPNDYASYKAEYDENGNCTYKAYFDENNKLTIPQDIGYAVLEMKYNENNNCIYKACYDEENQPMNGLKTGAFIIEEEYDENENLLISRLYDKEKKPVLSKLQNCAVHKYEYDEDDNCIHEWYYDTENELICCTDGYAEVVRTFNKNGDIISAVYYDENGKETEINNYA